MRRIALRMAPQLQSFTPSFSMLLMFTGICPYQLQMQALRCLRLTIAPEKPSGALWARRR
jgi:hypothetical protein